MLGFFFLTESADRAQWQGWNEHSVYYVPGVHCVARTVDPGLNIYSLSVFICVCLCVCVCARESESQCGCKSPAGVWGKKQQEAEKIPAAFGLVSANRKPGTVLHVPVHSLKASPCGII